MRTQLLPLPLVLAVLTAGSSTAQTTTEAYRLEPSDQPAPGDSVFSLSLAMDGDRAIVSDTIRGAWIYEVSSNTELVRLDAQGEPNEGFGYSVALDGDRAVVGMPGYDGPVNGGDFGCAWVYDTSSGDLLAQLQANGSLINDRQGNAVAISQDYIVLGAYQANLSLTSGGDQGAVHVFDRNSFAELYTIFAQDGESGDTFGSDVSIQGDRLLVGAEGDDGTSGSAYLYDLGTGALLTKIVATDRQPGDRFGHSVALDGDRALVGAWYDGNSNGDVAGAAYLFDLSTGQQLHKLQASDGAGGDLFGCSVALKDGLAVVGAFAASLPVYAAGAAYRFDPVTGQQLQKWQASTPAEYNLLGYDVATNGIQSLVSLPGSIYFGIPPTDSAACVFGAPTIGGSYCTANPNSTGTPGRILAFGSSEPTYALRLEASALPPGQFGYFLTSAAPGFIGNVAGSQGNLCLLGQIGRFVGPGQIQTTSAFGTATLDVDLTSLPIGAGLAVAPGDVWNFTFWFRDNNPNPTSNFTDAVWITFQ